MRFSFFIPGQLPGQNEIIEANKKCGGGRRFIGLGYTRMKAQWNSAIVAIIRSACKGNVPRFNFIHVDFVWHESKANRDPDNISAGQKFIFDALKDKGGSGVIANDGQKNVAGFSHTWQVSKTPGVWVHVEERFAREI